MGCWGIGSFANDDALDWVWDLETSDGLGAVADAFGAVPQGDYIEAPEAATAIAAAEIVAALLGQPATDLPVEVARWIAVHRSLDANPLRTTALNCIRAILGDESELRQLWEENEADFPFWKATVEALIARLSSAS